MIQFKINDIVVAKDPVNWKSFKPSFSRHVEYRGMISVFSKSALQFVKDGKQLIDAAYAASYVEAQATIELLKRGVSVFKGSIDFTQLRKKRTITEVGVQPSGFVMDWLNNDKAQLNLQELIDIRGNAVTAFTPETKTIPITDQLIVKASDLLDNGNPDSMGDNFEYQYIVLNVLSAFVRAPWFQLGSNITEYNELAPEVFSIPTGFLTGATGTAKEELTPFVEADWSEEGVEGDYQIIIDYDIDYTLDSGTDISGSATLKSDLRLLWYDEVEADDAILLETDSFTGSSHPIQLTGNFTGTYTYNKEFFYDPNTGIGSKLIAYMDNTITGGTGNQDLDFKITVNNWRVRVTKNSTYPEFDIEALLPWEAFLRCLQKLTGVNDCLRSSIFGRTDGAVNVYDENGEFSLLSFTSAKLLRGFTIADAPIATSFNDLFKIYDAAVGPLAVSVILEAGVEYISIEKVQDAYKGADAALFTIDPETKDTVQLPFKDCLFNQVKVGYSKWENERTGLLNAFHTERIYKTDITAIDSTYDAMCNAIAAGPTIERIRRERDLRKDNRYDEDLILIQLQLPGGIRPEIGSDLAATPTGVDNPAKAYNYNISPARMAIRHAALFANGITTPTLTFVRGSGNTVVSSQLVGEGVALSENQDLDTELEASLYIGQQTEITTIVNDAQLLSMLTAPEGTVLYGGVKHYILSGSIKAINNNEFEVTLVQANV